MIDTDKYEGHTDDYIWTWKQYASHFDHDADRALIQDAPLLLAEVKQFHEMKKWLLENHTQVMLQYTYGRVD
tara:strand:- start:894 stop:1109 length:216 start_codon:yes stop_codon:yes gene_type:complete